MVKPVPFTWQFKLKPLDEIEKELSEKIRCCLSGDKQVEYVDFNPEILYTPVAFHIGIRMLLSVAAAENDNVEGGDVGNAYLYGDIDIDIIKELPTNFYTLRLE